MVGAFSYLQLICMSTCSSMGWTGLLAHRVFSAAIFGRQHDYMMRLCVVDLSSCSVRCIVELLTYCCRCIIKLGSAVLLNVFLLCTSLLVQIIFHTM